MQIDIPLLQSLARTAGAPAHEGRIRRLIQEIVRPWVEDAYTDNMGNLVAVKRGRTGAKKVALAAHIDEIAFMVTHIEDEGFVRFIPLGGFDPRALVSQRVLAHGREDLPGAIAIKPLHISTEEDLKKPLEIEHLMMDFGLPAEELREALAVGDVVTRVGDVFEMGRCLCGKSLDNRISAYILIEILRQMASCEYDIYAAFTVQEEVGLRGADVFAKTLAPDFGLNIDTTIAYDLAGARAHERITRLGDGVGLKLFDSGVIVDKRMYNYLRSQALRENIAWQPEVMKRGGTDTAALQRGGMGGAIAGALSIPTRHIHTSVETVHKADVLAAIHLGIAALQNLHTFELANQA